MTLKEKIETMKEALIVWQRIYNAEDIEGELYKAMEVLRSDIEHLEDQLLEEMEEDMP